MDGLQISGIVIILTALIIPAVPLWLIWIGFGLLLWKFIVIGAIIAGGCLLAGALSVCGCVIEGTKNLFGKS